MRRSFPLNGILVVTALMAALLLTVFRQSPEGFLTLGLGERAARAAPGQSGSSAIAKKKHNLTALKVFNLALVRVRDQYVDTRRIDPKQMMYAALDSVELNVPEVLVESYPERDEVVVVVNDKSQTFSTKDVDSPWRLSGKLKDVFRFIQANMNPGADLAQVEYSAVNGMLSTLDPHSVLLDPEAANEMDVSTSGHFGGLGIVIGMRKGKLTVIRPMPETPAADAGVKAKDHIFRINNEATDHLTLTGAVSRMRGKEGTKVTIWVKREGESKDLEFQLTRARIRVPSVESKYLDSHNVGYIKIKNFQASTSREVKQAMKDMRKQGATGWVLDLRNNPGGLLEQAIQVSDLFVDRGTIVTTVGGKERDARRATKSGTDKTSPVAVLVNGQSASASEIVAGALKNLDRAVVVGSTTFGKGSVQILYENKDGSKLKLTIAEYLTPGDISIQSVGVPPDVDLVRMYVPKKIEKPMDQIRLMRTKHTFREADLDAHLTSKHARAVGDSADVMQFLYEPLNAGDDADDEDGDANPLNDEPVDTDEIVEDFEMKFARDLVAQARSSKRSRILKESKRFFSKRRAAEKTKVAAALEALGIDWSAPAKRATSKADLSATISFAKEDGTEIRDGKIVAGDTIKVTGTVTNSGTAPAYRLQGQLQTDDRVFDETELVFGKVDPGASRTFTTWLKVPTSGLDRVDPLKVVFAEHNGARVAVGGSKLRIVAQDRPVFSYTHQLIDDGNGDGLVQKGESMRLLMTFENTGTGKAHDVTAVLSNKSGGNLDGVVINKGRFQFDDGIKPGESKTVEFSFDTNGEFDRDELVLEMSVYDSVLSEAVTDKLKYPIHSRSAGPKSAKGTVRVLRGDTPLREGASEDSTIVGFAKRGAVLGLTATQSGFYRVEIDEGRPAFVSADAVKKGGGRAHNKPFTPHWQVTPPTVALELPTLETSSDHYNLKGTATDDTHVEDVYIFVSNRDAKIDNKKVFYKSNRSGKADKEMKFESEIPLWPGSNFVTVVVRENDQVRSARYMYLHRDAAKGTASVR
jgi:carboxyl-terminal processing protease